MHPSKKATNKRQRLVCCKKFVKSFKLYRLLLSSDYNTLNLIRDNFNVEELNHTCFIL